MFLSETRSDVMCTNTDIVECSTITIESIICKWVLRNSNRDAVYLETIMRFEGYEGIGIWGYEG